MTCKLDINSHIPSLARTKIRSLDSIVCQEIVGLEMTPILAATLFPKARDMASPGTGLFLSAIQTRWGPQSTPNELLCWETIPPAAIIRAFSLGSVGQSGLVSSIASHFLFTTRPRTALESPTLAKVIYLPSTIATTQVDPENLTSIPGVSYKW